MTSYTLAEESDDVGLCIGDCTCETIKSGEVKCTNSSVIPNLKNKQFIHSLSIQSHHITALKKGDFENFTKLEQLDLSVGELSTVGAGTFESVRETIKLINIRGNVVNELEAGVFSDLPVLNQIILNSNHLTSLKANSFVSLPKLTTLNILNNRIQSIDKKAFQGVSAVESLNFFSNHLKEIPLEALTPMTSLKILYLTNNEIEAMPDPAKGFLPALEDIYLDSNPIKEVKVFPNISNSLMRIELDFTKISSITKETWKYLPKLVHLNLAGTKFLSLTAGMFDGLQNVQRLVLRDMPLLNSIGPDAFRGLQNVASVDLDDCKQLHTIDETAFISAPKVKSFFLKGSGVTYIPEKLFNWSKMESVIVVRNPINCDCKVKWMLNSSIFGNNTNAKNSFDQLICATPKAHVGKNVTVLRPVNLTCKSYEDDHATRFATGIIIAVICFVLMTTFALIMKFRKRILISCRRYYQYRRYKNDLVFTVEHDTSIAELEDTDLPEGRPLKDMKLETVPIET